LITLLKREESTKGRMSPKPQLTGMAKTFNSVTFTGRANVAKATYAGIILIVAAVKAKNYIKAQ